MARYPLTDDLWLAKQISWPDDSFRAVLVQIDPDTGAAYAYSDAHRFLSDITSSSIVGTSELLDNKTSLNGVASCGPLNILGPTPGMKVGAFILYKDTGNPATSPLILYIDDTNGSGLNFTSNGARIALTFPNKLFKL